jgi:hypothetical protein
MAMVWGDEVDRQAREELAGEDHRRAVNARKAQLRQRELNREGFLHFLCDWLSCPWGGDD